MAEHRAGYGQTEYEDEAFLGGLGALGKIAGTLLGEGEGEAEEEMEGEFEDEFEDELESYAEGEDFFNLGNLAKVAGSFLGEGEDEFEFEDEFEDEFERDHEDEAFLGGLASIAGSLLGEGELELEDEAEAEDEAEEFFKQIGGFLKRNAPLLKKIAKVAAPMIATAVGGPAAGAVARALTSQLEGEAELEGEFEAEYEALATGPISNAHATAERLAAQASTARSESEAEAFAGGAVSITLSRRDRRDLQRMLPALLRGSAALTRVLYRDPRTRGAVRLVPSIVDAAGGALANRAASGEPVGPAEVGSALGLSTRRILGGGRWTAAAGRRHSRGLAYARQYGTHHRHHHGAGRYPSSHRRHYGVRRGAQVPTLRRSPTHVRAVRTGAPVARPRPGFVRVVTPVKVPGRNGSAPRTVKVVSDVRVPPGARPVGRPAAVGAQRRK